MTTTKKFRCKCNQRSYNRQSSLFNHIKLKHGNQKDKFIIRLFNKTGRPKKLDTDVHIETKFEKEVFSKNKDAKLMFEIYKNTTF